MYYDEIYIIKKRVKINLLYSKVNVIIFMFKILE